MPTPSDKCNYWHFRANELAAYVTGHRSQQAYWCKKADKLQRRFGFKTWEPFTC